MPFGSILASLTEFRLDAADGQTVNIQNNLLTRILLKLVGLPHIGLRVRAQFVMSTVQKTQPRVIVDAGSGNGLYTLELARRGYAVHAIEIDEDKASRVASYATELDFGRVTIDTANGESIDRLCGGFRG